jgi:hypothetical protein
MRYISKHISWKEATHSNTAEKEGIKNNPNESQIQAMKKIAKEVFEPLRLWADESIRINSFFRSPELCKAIGSKKTSQHARGQAIDIDALGEKTNADLFYYIKENLDFDQIIWEFGDDDNPDWVHVSYVSVNGNRKRALKAFKENGKTKYSLYA